MAKILSKGAKLGYSTTSPSTSSDYTDLSDLVSIPALGEREQVETTTLADEGRTYIDGLIGGELEFGFVYDDTATGTGTSTTQYQKLKALENTEVYWQITIPASSGGTALHCTFTGTPRVNFNAFEVGARIDYTLKISVKSNFVIA